MLWRRVDRAGHEAARVVRADDGWRIEGAAVFLEEREVWRLDYEVVCDGTWRTRGARVAGWGPRGPVRVELRAEGGRWWRDGREQAQVAGAVDVDLGFSPATNTLPIRRLGLEVGAEAPVRAAWLSFPGLALEPLEQVYRRVGERSWRYSSAGGRFVAALEVDAEGLVRDYEGLWRREG